MREIKFRYWDVEKKHMFHSDSQDDAKGLGAKLGSSLISAFFNKFYGLDTVEQFTWIKDKNGVDIYEGDIIKSPDEDISYCLCEFNSNNACFQINGYGKEMYLNENSGEEFSSDNRLIEEHILVLGGDNEIEVIGNIHQNPELLCPTN